MCWAPPIRAPLSLLVPEILASVLGCFWVTWTIGQGGYPLGWLDGGLSNVSGHEWAYSCWTVDNVCVVFALNRVMTISCMIFTFDIWHYLQKFWVSQGCGLSSSHVWMWELDSEESWLPKNWCFWTVVLKTLESPLDCKEIQPVPSKGDQSWVFFGRNDAKAETPVLWPLHAKSWVIGKDSEAGRDWEQEEKGTTEDEMAGWHHWLDGSEFEWTQGVGDGQGGLACCDSWGLKESDTKERLNWTEQATLNFTHFVFLSKILQYY